MFTEEKAAEEIEANAISVIEGNLISNSHQNKGKNTFKTKPKCTPTECIGQHDSDLCWAKPKNHATRDKRWVELINAGKWKGEIPSHLQNQIQNSANSSSISTNEISELTSAMNSLKTSLNSSSSSHITSLNAEYTCSNSAITSTIPKGDWGLHDTGASHHMFKDLSLFKKDSL